MKRHLWYILPIFLTLSVGIGAMAACGSEPETYTLAYDLDGGSGALPEGGSYAEGDLVSVASGSGLSKEEFVFDGWLDGTAKVGAGSEYRMPARDVTLKANWRTSEFAVTYSLGEHAAADATVPAQEPAADGVTMELPASVKAAKGWLFAGWETGTKSVPLTEGKCLYTVSADDVTDGTISFTAQYTPKQYNVRFDKGKAGDVAVENWPDFAGTISLGANDTLTFLDTPACDGWEFKGWSFYGTDLGETLEFRLSEELLPDEDGDDVVFTAEWRKPLAVSVSAGRETITVNITGEDDALAGGATLVSMKTYEYFEGDESHGLSQAYSEGTTVGTYASETFGEDAVITLDRFENDRDRLYDKYYLVRDNALLKGPYYVSKVTETMTEGTRAPEYMDRITTKKGVLAENAAYVDELGAQHARWDFCLDGFYFPGASPDSADATAFELNGKNFYFHTSAVERFDSVVQTYSQREMDIIVVVYIHYDASMPDDMTYKAFGAWDGFNVNPIAGYNTSNEGGLEWWAATMEFLAQRYSGAAGSKGYISTYVIGNEVDFEGDYFRIAKEHQPVDTFVEEYGRCLRIADLAVKKYNPDIQVTTTLTHSWVEPGNTSNFNERNYSPKEILEKLNAKSKREGDFNWGIAPHPYCYSLPATRMLEYDTDEGYKDYRMTGDVETSSFLTYSNLEILAQFLDREENKFEGKARDVFLTESGVSSAGYYGFGAGYKTTDDEELSQSIQAAMIAYTWYKASQLDCVKVYAYYRMYDIKAEGENFRPGLIDYDGNKKKSFELWKYIDTQKSFEYSMKYIQSISYYDNDGSGERTFLTYLNGFTSYLDILDTFHTGYDFSDFDDQKAMPVWVGDPAPAPSEPLEP